ncbi:MAG TPA: PilZ domain-containing protein [Sphingomonas sp.]|nr:PilZ domain-containing protein [Sphingomonas sp.]
MHRRSMERFERMEQAQHKPRHEAAAASGGGQRQDSRDSLFLSARFRLKGEKAVEQIRIRNLSAGGLMAELPEGIEPDTEVEVEVRGIGWISGRIAWTAVGRAGVAFDKPVDPKKARKPVGARGASAKA